MLQRSKRGVKLGANRKPCLIQEQFSPPHVILSISGDFLNGFTSSLTVLCWLTCPELPSAWVYYVLSPYKVNTHFDISGNPN